MQRVDPEYIFLGGRRPVVQVTLIARCPADVSPSVAARSALSLISTKTTAAPAWANAYVTMLPKDERILLQIRHVVEWRERIELEHQPSDV